MVETKIHEQGGDNNKKQNKDAQNVTSHEHHHNHETHSNHSQHNHDDHQSHGDHSHHGHHDHGDMVTDFKKRFYISLIITIPILILSPMLQDLVGLDFQVPFQSYILFLLSTFVFFYGGDRKSTRLNS